MPTNAIESGVGDTWQCKQTALGTIQPPADLGNKHLHKSSDDALKAAKVYGSKEWVDGKQFGSPSMYVDTVGGAVGSVTSDGLIETAGFMVAQVVGVDVVTGIAPDFTHTISTGTANGPYQTFRQKVGATVGPWRNSFFDAKINKATINCSQQDKVMEVQQEIMAMKAANWFTVDPTATDAGTDPFNWNEATGAHTIDSGTGPVAFEEIDGETVEIDRKLDVHRGDSPAPVCFVPGKGEINSSCTALVTDNTIPVIKRALFGTVTPVDGQGLSSTVNYIALESTYTRTAVRSLKITRPRVAVNPENFEIGPHAGGGKIPITFGGQCLDSGTASMLTVVAKTSDATSYV